MSGKSVFKVSLLLGKTPGCAEVERLLNSIYDEGDFHYLAALTNHSKHHSLIRPALWADMRPTATQRYTLHFQGFTHLKRTYEKREAWPFLEKEYDRLSRIVVAAGHEVNATLRARST